MSGQVRKMLLGSVAVAGVLAVSACGGGYNSDSKSESKSDSKPAVQAPAAPASGAVALVSAQSPSLGAIVTDAAGFTLYRFDKDTAKPSKSNCADECASTWPPVTSPADPALTGIDAGLLGSVKRADGSRQVTLKGWPLYRFAADSAAGQTNGHGVGGTWFAITPQGGKAGTAAAQPAAEQPASNEYGSDYNY